MRFGLRGKDRRILDLQRAALRSLPEVGIEADPPEALMAATAADLEGDLPTVIGLAHAYDPALDALPEIGTPRLVRLTYVGPAPALREDCALLCRLFGQVADVARSPRQRGWDATVRFDSLAAPVRLTGVVTALPQIEWRLDLLDADRHVRATFPPLELLGQGTAVEIFSADGARTLPATPEDGYRAAWRDLQRVVATGAEPRFSRAQAEAAESLYTAISGP